METRDGDMKSREAMLEEIRRILHQVLAGTLEARKAIDSWPPLHDRGDKALRGAFEELHHYLADEDIRAKEPEYGHRQRDRLRAYLKEIENIE